MLTKVQAREISNKIGTKNFKAEVEYEENWGWMGYLVAPLGNDLISASKHYPNPEDALQEIKTFYNERFEK